jgi:hypothetical protein
VKGGFSACRQQPRFGRKHDTANLRKYLETKVDIFWA